METIDVLEKIDFTVENGLIYCKKLETCKHISEWLHIKEKAESLNVEAILFRRLLDNNENLKNSKPIVYIFKDEVLINNNISINELHSKIWSAGDIDIYIIIGNSSIKIINARRPAKVGKDDLEIDDLILWTGYINDFNDSRFSAQILGKGLFWEQEDFYDDSKDLSFIRNKLDESNTPYHQLFTFLREIRKYLLSNSDNNSIVIDKLLIICILIKFLEEIKDDNNQHTLSEIYDNLNIKNFASALFKNKDTGVVVDILEEIGKKSNGKIFDYFIEQEEGETEEEFNNRNSLIKQELRTKDLSVIADFLLVRLNKETGELDFDLNSKQIKIDFPEFKWSQYSFRYLPIELISSIYEHFLQEDAKLTTGSIEKNIVYTPPFLVNYLIDEVMPLENYNLISKQEFTILDPSCGSGIFLVAAYKRLINWWILDYHEKYNQFPIFDAKTFQNILENNIYGVDVSPKATLISIFSLTIAFLDKLKPIAFWNNLNFNKLKQNISTSNFFDWSLQHSQKFDLVIGNPPFNPENGKKVEYYLKKTYLEKPLQRKIKIPRNNLALHFLESSIAQAQQICLILPSKSLLYSKTSHNYRKRLLSNFTVDKIFDFTHLRGSLFKDRANVGICAVLVKNKPSNKNKIQHVVIKRMLLNEQKVMFDIDYYDYHYVRWDWAVDDKKQFIWKVNLMGGGRLINLINRFSSVPTLQDFIKNRKWKAQRGFEGGSSYILKNVSRIISIGDNGINISEDSDINTDSLKDTSIYKPPFIVFHQFLGKMFFPSYLVYKGEKDFIFYNRDFVGIKPNDQDLEYLEKLDIYLRSNSNSKLNVQTYLIATSNSLMISHETALRQEEILNIPFCEKEDYLLLSFDERIIQWDLLTYYIHLGKGIKEGKGTIFNNIPSHKELYSFGKVFCKIMNTMYEVSNEDGILKKWEIGEVVVTPNLIFYKFLYGTPKSKKFGVKKMSNKDYLKMYSLIYNQENTNAVYKRVIKVYNHFEGYDTITFIKPNSIRYWLRSIALRDADDVIWDMYKAGF